MQRYKSNTKKARSIYTELYVFLCEFRAALQVFEVGSFGRAVEVVAGFAAPYDLAELSVGGGLGVA